MLTRLRIQNFKAWQDTGDIRLAPLTVFFGTNSSGKTSLLQFPLMLKQTVQSSDRKRVLHFGDKRSLVDLGVWPEMVFRHNEAQLLKFEIEWHSTIDDSPDSAVVQFKFRAAVGSLQNEKTLPSLKTFEYTFKNTRTLENQLLLSAQHSGPKQYDFCYIDPDVSGQIKPQSMAAEPSNFHRLTFSSPLPAGGQNAVDMFSLFLERQLELLFAIWAHYGNHLLACTLGQVMLKKLGPRASEQ